MVVVDLTSASVGVVQEVTAFEHANDDNNWWKTAEGVYFPVSAQ